MDVAYYLKWAERDLADARRGLDTRIGADRIMDAAGFSVLHALEAWCEFRMIPRRGSYFDLVSAVRQSAPEMYGRACIPLDRLVVLRRYHQNWPAEDGEPRPTWFTLEHWISGMEEVIRDAESFLAEVRAEIASPG